MKSATMRPWFTTVTCPSNQSDVSAAAVCIRVFILAIATERILKTQPWTYYLRPL
jgi:hypothetical protein